MSHSIGDGGFPFVPIHAQPPHPATTLWRQVFSRQVPVLGRVKLRCHFRGAGCQTILGRGPLTGAKRTPVAIVPPRDRILPFMSLVAQPPDSSCVARGHVFWRERTILHRVPLLRQLWISSCETVIRADFVSSTIWTCSASLNSCNGRFPLMSFGTLPPNDQLGMRPDVARCKTTILRRVPERNDGWATGYQAPGFVRRRQ